ncbi:MAG: reverse transcriptase domain-containing protein [Acidobacteriota bacterium]|nr:reverse transcriptase domain-containing protein [Acidobacteriota bacterium]
MHKKLTPFDQLCQPETLLAAWKPVRTGRTAAGVDQVTLAEYARDLEANIAALAERLREGRYYPLPVRTIEIRKPGGGTRQLGIYTIEDSIVQRAAKDLLEPLFEPSFLPCSFGFRPERNVPMAVRQVLDYRAAGDVYLVDADISDCFGSLDHDLILQLFSARVRDKRFQHLVRLWLDTGRALPKPGQVAEGGLYNRVTEWLSDSMDGAVSHLLNDRIGYTPPVEAYGAPLPDEAPSPDEARNQARKEALKRAGGAGLMWALTYAGRARKLMSPTTLALAGAAVLTAAAAPTVTRAVKQYLNPDDGKSGIVQGGAVSPLLSNVYLHEFDVAMTKAGLHLVRYADDFVICCRDEAAARQAMALAAQKLVELRLRQHPQKTRIVRFDEGLEFLGYRFAQFENTATPISPKNTSPVVTALQAVSRKAPAALQEAKNKIAPRAETAARQIKDKAARLGSLLRRKQKGESK